ncbi:MAG: DNA cytosine methyltransferase [Pseudomonadota bacterium]
MTKRTFIDLFAGCGGLSLGLSEAGWSGVFAVEKTEDAFKTFKHNLITYESPLKFDWPDWLPKEPISTGDLLLHYHSNLKALQGKIDLIAGGPPCQGFSIAGKRNPSDARNRLTEEYIKIVGIVQPKYLLLENVRGFQTTFDGCEKPYSELVEERLAACGRNGYKVYASMISASDFGIPQPRNRYIMMAVRGDLSELRIDPFVTLASRIEEFRKDRGLNGHEIGVGEAISDLEIRNQKLTDSVDSVGFKQIKYTGRRRLTPYQKHMRRDVEPDFEPDSLRLPNHTEVVAKRFQKILKECPRGVSLSSKHRKRLGMKKQCFTPLHPSKLARTVTTLPDDMIHYKEPRVLTVRESARLQSFPDWFEFLGRYTTGGERRKTQCPRYTQVGNAVPPLMAEAIGELLLDLTD